MRVRYLLAVAFDSNRHHFSVERFLLHILISPPACSLLTSQMRRGGRAQLFPCFVLFVFATSCGRCLYVCGLLNRDPLCVLDPECSRQFSSSQQQLTSRVSSPLTVCVYIFSPGTNSLLMQFAFITCTSILQKMKYKLY